MKKGIDREIEARCAEPGLGAPDAGLALDAELAAYALGAPGAEVAFVAAPAELALAVGATAGAPSPSLATGEAKRALGWHERGYLPHFDAIGAVQFVTFRLADSLPGEVLQRLERELPALPPAQRQRESFRRIERLLDSGMGSCALRHPTLAAVMRDTLLKYAPQRYRLIAWCIMPNHVHVLIEARCSLPKIVQSWKSFTGRWALAHWAELGLGAAAGGRFWQCDYWDRFIRDEAHYRRVVAYIHENPMLAGLCKCPADWEWSSATPGSHSPATREDRPAAPRRQTPPSPSSAGSSPRRR